MAHVIPTLAPIRFSAVGHVIAACNSGHQLLPHDCILQSDCIAVDKLTSPTTPRSSQVMSFDRLNSLEAQPTPLRRSEDPQYRDDPEFHRLTENLSNQLFNLTSNISRLSNQIALLGTKRDTDRVRERVHDLLDETRSGFKDVGDGIKKVQTWEDVNVRYDTFPSWDVFWLKR